jgi:hypothetical protein
MGRKKNKRLLPPRTLRMNRSGRLRSGRHWRGAQAGRAAVQIARSYRKRYGVDWPCAVQELSMLGIRLEPDWLGKLHRSLKGNLRTRQKRREKLETEAEYDSDSDEHFAYIAGYTAGGAAYGLTWEEWRQMDADEGGK